MLVNFPKINYRHWTACLILLTALTVSSCGRKADDSATNASGDSTAQTDRGGTTTAQDPTTTTGAKKANARSSKLSAEAKKLGVTPTGTTCPANAPIKGNINNKGNKIYHEAKAKGFDKIKPEICFADAATAKKAGFVAPKAATPKATKTP